MVPIKFKKVVFPPPEGPRMITNSPRLIAPYLLSPLSVIFLSATTL